MSSKIITLAQLTTFLTQLKNTFAKAENVDAALAKKQDTLTFDTTPTSGSTNPVTSGGVYDAIEHLPSILLEDESEITLTPIDFYDSIVSSTEPTESCSVWIETED